VQRLSRPQRRLLTRLAEVTTSYGLALATDLGLSTASVYPSLQRLEGARLVVSELEPGDPATLGRRPRRLYRLTDEGARLAAWIRADTAAHARRDWKGALGWRPAQ
jgi:DNA-binding PadR family transcriptional regulator